MQMLSPAAWLASQPLPVRLRELSKLSVEAKAQLNWDWKFWARPSQLAPVGDWIFWLFIAGRGAGKTRSGAEWVRQQVQSGKGRIALIAPTAADARDVMVEGESGLLSVCWKNDHTYLGEPIGMPVYEPSKRRLTWKNGAQAVLFSAEEPERLRGPQHDAAWCDEMAAWSRMEAAWDMAMFGLRLGERPRAMVTTTPKPSRLLRSLLKDKRSVVTRGTTFDNSANLAATFLETVRERYEGTRLGRQELNAELLDDVPGALWTVETIKRGHTIVDFSRVVVGVDPSGTSGKDEEKADSVGIVIAAKGVDGRYYVLEDATCSLSPSGWGRRVVMKFKEYNADRVVAERNYGGDMVEHVIQTADQQTPVELVTATRGKVVRAEPIAALYEQGRVTHVGDPSKLTDLEDQMLQMTSSGYVGEGSPDRVDALVWALTKLAFEDRGDPRIRSL